MIIKKAVEISISEFKYKETLVYEIDFDKGSTKAKVAFFAFLNGMIFYADLKESIKTIYNDVQWLSEQVISNARQDSNLIDNNIIRTERRTGIIGRLKKVLSRIEFLQSNLNNLANNQVEVELIQLYQEVANLLQLLDNIQRQSFIQSLSQEIRTNLPIPHQNEVLHLERLYAIKPD
jgi:flagellin-specific chaperone FliS